MEGPRTVEESGEGVVRQMGVGRTGGEMRPNNAAWETRREDVGGGGGGRVKIIISLNEIRGVAP